MKLSEHFTFEELTDSVNHPELVEQNRIDALEHIKKLRYVAGTLEEVRGVLGCKIRVTSGYRNDSLNEAVGSKPSSSHLKALCADIIPYEGTVQEAFEKIKFNKHLCPSLRKCIIEGDKGKVWLHIQTKLTASEPTEFYTSSDGKNFTRVG